MFADWFVVKLADMSEINLISSQLGSKKDFKVYCIFFLQRTRMPSDIRTCN